MIPVITSVSSILGFRRNESFQFQPSATNSPTSWAATGLPPGVSINTTTGLISGAIPDFGVWVAAVTATNASGTSAAVQFVFGTSREFASPTSSGAAATAQELVWNIASGVVAIADPAAAALNILWKSGDTRLIGVRLRRDDVAVDPSPTHMRLSLRADDTEPVVVDCTDFQKLGSGESAVWLLALDMSEEAVARLLADAEGADRFTRTPVRGEFEMRYDVAWGGGTKSLRISSRSFDVVIERDLGPNA